MIVIFYTENTRSSTVIKLFEGKVLTSTVDGVTDPRVVSTKGRRRRPSQRDISPDSERRQPMFDEPEVTVPELSKGLEV